MLEFCTKNILFVIIYHDLSIYYAIDAKHTQFMPKQDQNELNK